MGFKDEVDNDKKDGDFYKMKEGEQKFRIMSEPIKKSERFGHGICYPGALYCDPATLRKDHQEAIDAAKRDGQDPEKVKAPSITTKYMCWALLRGDKPKMVILQLPKKLAEKLRMWMDSDEYGFQTFPMPYDLSIIADENVGKATVKYDMLAARKETPLTQEELDDFAKVTPINQILERLQTKQKQKVEGGGTSSASSEPIEYPHEDINPDDIPF